MEEGKSDYGNNGRFVKGIIPSNKIVLPEKELRDFYTKMGSKKIAEYYGVSKQTVLKNLREYGVSIRSPGTPLVLPEYWKKALRKPKSVPSWIKGLTKETDDRVKKISDSLTGEKNVRWRPEIHTNEMVECRCGCGGLRPKYDKRGRERFYIPGHSRGGRFKKGDVPWNKGKKWDSEIICRILTRRTPNKQENFLIKFFKEYNLLYRFVGDGQIIIGGRNPDFIHCNGQSKIIEFFGEYWHKPEDEDIKRKIYEQYGYKMLVIWGKELRDQEKLLIKILKFDGGV